MPKHCPNKTRTHSLAVALGLALLLARAAEAQNFTITLDPGSVTLVPTKTAAFVVSLTPIGGFNSEVVLAVGTLPPGVTAEFSANRLSPPATALLTLRGDTTAAVGTFTLNVIGSGGGITNDTAGMVDVQFGLLPLCKGAFQGTVTDIETGLPVSDAQVETGGQKPLLSDATGYYLFTNVSLGTDNMPSTYTLRASHTGYWHSGYIPAWAVCDTTNTVDLPMLRQRFGSVSGTVLFEGGAPAANVQVCAQSACTNTDANGAFQLASLALSYGNQPRSHNVQATATGYWTASSQTTVAADSNSVVSLVLTEICTASLTGQVFFADTMLPVTNWGGWVTQVGRNEQYVFTTDADGYYGVSGLPLAFRNTPVYVNIHIPAPTGDYLPFSKQVRLTNCFQILWAECFISPRPRYNYGAVIGHTLDAETGLPVPNASVSVSGWAQTLGGSSDAAGAYSFTNVNVGPAPATSYQGSVSASAPGYHQSGSSNVTVIADQTVTQDVRLVRIRYGAITGLVRDSATHLAIANASVQGSRWATVKTGLDGRYTTPPIPFPLGNPPIGQSIRVVADGYWTIDTNTTLYADTTKVVDIDLIKVCNGATIAGSVVNALTQEPVANATVQGPAGSVNTDTNGSFLLTGVPAGNFNSPRQVTLTASAPGFNSQSQTVTVFCGATITIDFGAPQTVFGAIEGFVTNALTGEALADVFLGSQFGAATFTDTNGYYRLDQVPLGANGADRTWTVTAMPNGFLSQTRSVLVSSNTVSRLDFGFGRPPAMLSVSASATPDPVAVSSNLLYTVTLQNTGADAANVQLKNTLASSVTFLSATITNTSGDFFTTPTFSNQMVTTTTTNFSSNSVAVLTVLVRPGTAGSLTNVATVASDTPDMDATGSNHTAIVITTVTGSGVPYADLALSLNGLPNPVLVGNQLTCTLVVTNAGPADAPGVTLEATLPAAATFISASTSQGSTIQNGPILHWDIGLLARHESATATVILVPLIPGAITHQATVTLADTGGTLITDPNLANNSASLVTTANAPAADNISVQVLGPIVFNRQTGLYEQPIQFNNLSGAPVSGVRISVNGLPADVRLYNASGSSNSAPFVEHGQTVEAGGSVSFLLEYYRSSRLEFVSTNFSAVAVDAAAPPGPSGPALQLDRDPFLSDGKLTIEFASTPGATYAVQYSPDLQTWKTAVPPIIAAGTRVHWIDAGPPKTDSPPGPPGQRFYRILKLP
jgi:uncharacterized repeat protein (TIGR01451 family)